MRVGERSLHAWGEILSGLENAFGIWVSDESLISTTLFRRDHFRCWLANVYQVLVHNIFLIYLPVCFVARSRYKLVVTVTMGERYMQGMKSIAQFLWDPEKDSYVSCIYDASPSLFAVATIYAIYFE